MMLLPDNLYIDLPDNPDVCLEDGDDNIVIKADRLNNLDSKIVFKKKLAINMLKFNFKSWGGNL